MNIHKHWKEICISLTTFFWAGCSDSSNIDRNSMISSSSEIASSSNAEKIAEKFSTSSSSAEQIVSCKLSDFYGFEELFDTVKKEMYQELLMELDGDGNVLTAEKRNILESFLDQKKETLTINPPDRGCSDGIETETDLYKERSEKIRNYIQGVIDNAWDGNAE